jgi:transposase
MIQVTPQMRILVAVEPADFRKGIDGLACLCRTVLGSDPFRGYVFAFGNRSRKSIKILVYDGQGFWLCQKRRSKGRFPWWPQARRGHCTLKPINWLSCCQPAINGSQGPTWRRVDPP